MFTEFKSRTELTNNFKTEQDCITYLESKLWENGKPTCPHCGSTEHYKVSDGNRYGCKKCRVAYNVKTRTIFENSKIKLSIWFQAIFTCMNKKKGISSIQLAEEMGITQKSSWFMLMRIRESFDVEVTDMETVVEISTTNVTGKYPHQRKDKTKRQSPVIGIVERNGNTKLRFVKNTDPILIIEETVKPISVVLTDNSETFKDLSKTYPEQEVISGVKNKSPFHLNTIRNRFSIVKTTIEGTYHHVSDKHLNRYCNEFSFRQNDTQIDLKKRLTYKQLIK